MNKIYVMYADGVRNGLCTAPDEKTALQEAIRGLTRRTDSKDGGEPDFGQITVKEFVSGVSCYAAPVRKISNVVPLRRAA